MKDVQTINPYTGKEIALYSRITKEESLDALSKAQACYEQWKATSYKDRAGLFMRLSVVLKTNKEKYGRLITEEMGKLYKQAVMEVEKCALICEHFALNAASYLQDQMIQTEASKSYITFQPIGVILAVMPWNFPFYQVIRFAAPSLMAGNTAVVKHASNVQGCAFAIEQAFRDAGFPEGVLVNMNVSSEHIEDLIGNKIVKAVTLTGSVPAGKAIAKAAGSHIKKAVMELGGNDPYIVLDDIDIEQATDLAIQGRLINNGQTCIAAKRFIVLTSVYDAFLSRFTEKMEAIKLGDPFSEDTTLGPLSRFDLRDQLHQQVEKSVSQGARLVTGGHIPTMEGAFYPPTILAEVKPGMECFENELFGPVASIIKARDEQEAIALANNSDFGLGSGVITGNPERGERIALQIESGNTAVNSLVASDPRLPFGGIKYSGYGRELSGFGIHEFVNIKSVWIK